LPSGGPRMRPRLRDDVRYVKSPDGVYIHSHGGSCALNGTQMYDWLSRLAPHLTGEHTLEELVAPLAADQRAMVHDLVRVLAEQRFVADVRQDEPHLLDADELRIYAAEIAFIRYALDSAERRFQRVRDARIVVLGLGPVLAAVLEAGLWSGWRDVRVLAPDSEVPVLRGVVERSCRDSKQSVELVSWFGEPGTGVVDRADVVLQVCERARRDDLIAVGWTCASSGIALGQVLVGEEEAWLTPVGMAERVEPEACWRRLAAHRGTEFDAAVSEDWLIGPVPGIVAAQLVLSCFLHLTGLDTLPPLDGAPSPPLLTRVDLRTLVTRTHRVPARPPSTTPTSTADARALLDEFDRGATVSAADLLERAAGFIDARTGLLGLLDEQELPQLPLSMCRARVGDPHWALPAWAPAPTVVGWAQDRPTARLRALLAALATYGSLAPGSAEPGDTVWGLNLATGQPRAVTAGLVYPVLGGAGTPYRAPVGAAAGLSWSDAVAAGLRAQCEALLAERSGRRRRAAVEVVTELGDEPAANLLRLLDAVGQQVDVADLTLVLELPAFAFHFESATPAMLVSCAASPAVALGDGLERILLRWQAHADHPVRWQVESDHEVFADAVRRAGRVPVAVPIARDNGLLPYVVQVVLCDD